MAGAGVSWETEDIPEDDALFMRAHAMHYVDGELQAGVFKERGTGISMDWSKYATAGDTRRRAKTPNQNAVIRLVVGSVRQIESLGVHHDPSPETDNRAHSEVRGIGTGVDKTRRRIELLRCATTVIPLDE